MPGATTSTKFQETIPAALCCMLLLLARAYMRVGLVLEAGRSSRSRARNGEQDEPATARFARSLARRRKLNISGDYRRDPGRRARGAWVCYVPLRVSGGHARRLVPPGVRSA